MYTLHAVPHDVPDARNFSSAQVGWLASGPASPAAPAEPLSGAPASPQASSTDCSALSQVGLESSEQAVPPSIHVPTLAYALRQLLLAEGIALTHAVVQCAASPVVWLVRQATASQ